MTYRKLLLIEPITVLMKKRKNKLCKMCLSLHFLFFLFTAISTADEVTIGTSQNEYYHLPMDPNYNFSYTQSLYLQSDLNLTDPVYIDSIKFHFNGNHSFADNIKVYLGHTTKSSFADTTDWISKGNMMEVYSGSYSVSASAGWYKIEFDESFYYNNSDNLVVAVDENTGTFHCSCNSFYTTSQGSNRSIRYYSDNTNPNPSNPPDAKSRSSHCSNIKIYYHELTTEDYSDWTYSKALFINTSSTGIEISGNVSDYPLLVRLNSSNFDFSQANSDGSDIRFTQGENQLNYEIERWDASSQKAEIWVKVNVVYADNSTQFITMYWGKTNVPNNSSPKSVFTSENDFKGVWHLDNFKDATVYANDGTNNNTAEVDGIIGKAKRFDGDNDYISLSDACIASGTWTLDFWIKPNNPDNYERIFIQGYDGCGSQQIMASWYGDHVEFRSTTDSSSSTAQIASGSIVDDEWSHVVWTFNGTTHNVYVNGVVSTGTVSTTSWDINGDIYIGTRNGSGNYWTGDIDEVRLSSGVRSADWIKLAHGNQSGTQSFVSGQWEFPEDCGPGENMKVAGKALINEELLITPLDDYDDTISLSNHYNSASDKQELLVKTPGGVTIESDSGTGVFVTSGSGLGKISTDFYSGMWAELTRGHGDWIRLGRDTGSGYWSIHNPSPQNRIEFGYKDDQGGEHWQLFSILNNGKVGIGTSSPSTKLDVVGTMKSDSLAVTGTIEAAKFKVGKWEIGSTPDYVFKKDYKLRSIKELEEFINKNSHLPDVPSAEDMTKEGVDLAKMNMILLKKIEEMTLYLIEQQKEIEELKKK